jgi:hypothetical protein
MILDILPVSCSFGGLVVLVVWWSRIVLLD